MPCRELNVQFLLIGKVGKGLLRGSERGLTLVDSTC